jgi:hypothetical protein
MSLIWPAPLFRDPDIYVTDFSEYAAGTLPSDWTLRWDSSGAAVGVQTSAGTMSGKAMRYVQTAAGRRMVSWDRVPQRADFEVLARSRAFTAPATPQALMRLTGRASGTTGSENAYSALSFYHTSATSNLRSQLTKYLSGTGSILNGPSEPGGPSYSGTAPTGFVWVRLRCNGTSIQRKCWQQGQNEPAGWDATSTDSGVTTGGWIGLMSVDAAPSIECDFFSVALAGKTASSVRR